MTTYARLDEPQDLITKNAPTNVINFSDGVTTVPIAKDTPFTAVGKATTDDGSVYFMSANCFANADTTGTPFETYGIKTVDLSPADSDGVTAVESDPPSDDSEKVPVNVQPWQATYKAFMGGSTKYVANQDVTIQDEADNSPLSAKNLLKGTIVNVAGTFSRDGVKYYRTAVSAFNNVWYGIPVTALTKPQNDDDLDELLEDMHKEGAAIASSLPVTKYKFGLFHKKK